MSTVFPAERIERAILILRGHKVILDRDLAAMYGVSTRDLNKACRGTSTDFQKISCFSLPDRNSMT